MMDTRQFKVVVNIKGMPFIYPEATGEKSLALMERLSKEGFKNCALTHAGEMDEVYTLVQMRDIYQGEMK